MREDVRELYLSYMYIRCANFTRFSRKYSRLESQNVQL